MIEAIIRRTPFTEFAPHCDISLTIGKIMMKMCTLYMTVLSRVIALFFANTVDQTNI